MEMIIKYAGLFAREINPYLRNSESLNEELDKKALLLDAELNLLPGYDNRIVYAKDFCTGLDFSILAMWYSKRIGQKVSFPNFLSTSSNKWDNEPNDSWYVIKTITNSNGRSIEDIVRKKSESEVLFKMNTCFLIESVNYADNIINLIEIKDSEASIILHEYKFLEDKEVSEIYYRDNPLDDDDDIQLSLSDQGLI